MKEVGQEPAAEVYVAQIVDLTTEKDGKSEKSEKVVHNSSVKEGKGTFFKTTPCVHSVVMRGVCAGCGQDFRQVNANTANHLLKQLFVFIVSQMNLSGTRLPFSTLNSNSKR